MATIPVVLHFLSVYFFFECNKMATTADGGLSGKDMDAEKRFNTWQARCKLFEDAPGWMSHNFTFPALPPSEPQSDVKLQNVMYYEDQFYHHLMALASCCFDLGTHSGPAILLGCGPGGTLPIIKDHMPKLERLVAVDFNPAVLARAQRCCAADFINADVCQIESHVAPQSMPFVIDDIVLSYPTYADSSNYLFEQGMQQIHTILSTDGYLVASLGYHPKHPRYASLEKVLTRIAEYGFQLVAHKNLNEVIVPAIKLAAEHHNQCLSPDVVQAHQTLLKYLNDTNDDIEYQMVKKGFMCSAVVLKKADPATALAHLSTLGLDEASQQAHKEEVYKEDVECWYEQYQLEGRSIPGWMRQLSYPCLPPPGMPAQPDPGVNHHFYLDAFYHRIMALAATAIDLKMFTGPCIFTGCGFGGMVPILRQHMPALDRLVAGDIVPLFIDTAMERKLNAEFCVLDVLALDRQFEAGSFRMLLDDAIVSHMRNHGGPESHLFKPAVRQVHKLLAPGGYFLPNGSIAVDRNQTSERIIEDIESEGFRLLACEDLTADCVTACDLMEEHMLGSQDRIGCITAEDRELYPELVDDVRDAFTQYYRFSMSHGFKALGHWVFQKV